MGRLALLLLFASMLPGAEDRLAAIHALLVSMRTAPIADARGATPALTNVKHQLREWIEFHVSALQWKDARWTPNPSVLQEQLNDELSQADLFCPQNATFGENPLGYLDRVVLEIQSGFLVVRTSIGVQTCGTDDSAYIYESTDDRWRPESDHTEHLIVTTGVFPWCSSVWQPVYYRVWQTKSTYSDPRLLLDDSEQADIAAPIHARANQKDVFIEFQIIADDAMRVSELQHYVLVNGKLHRTDPVALTPHEFVSFWLRHPWNEVSEWTAQTGRVSMKAWHQRYRGTNSEFTSPTRHCTLHADLWQVATDPSVDPQPAVHYFLIRARLPFRFTLVAASERPWPDCTEGDPAIDNAPDLLGK